MMDEVSRYDPEDDYPPLNETISPRVLKAITDSPQFRKAYKSFKFGNLTPITSKWYIWVIVAVGAVFAILIVTGNFNLG